MSPEITFDECSTPPIGGAGAGHLLGPWMPMAGAATDGFDQCSTQAVALSEGSTPAVALTESSVIPVTFDEGAL